MGRSPNQPWTWRPAALLLIVAGCASNPAPPPPAPELPDTPIWRQAVSRLGRYRVHWRPAFGHVPVNEPFELLVRVETNANPPEPVSGAQVFVQGEMPAHGHGMLREPRALEERPGLYRVRGMLLHMTGHWTLAIDVVADGRAEGADFELEL